MTLEVKSGIQHANAARQERDRVVLAPEIYQVNLVSSNTTHDEGPCTFVEDH